MTLLVVRNKQHTYITGFDYCILDDFSGIFSMFEWFLCAEKCH